MQQPVSLHTHLVATLSLPSGLPNNLHQLSGKCGAHLDCCCCCCCALLPPRQKGSVHRGREPNDTSMLVCKLHHLAAHQPQDYAPDVVYSLATRQDTTVTVSTCGSAFDTKLILTTDPGDPSTYVINDDDRDCQTDNRCSKITSYVKVR
jgi:hypothetical protein